MCCAQHGQSTGPAQPPGPNLISRDGKWHPKDGYDWVSGVAGDFRVSWVPNRRSDDHPHIVSSEEEGMWYPEDGYTWVIDPPVPGDFRVTWTPNRDSKNHPHVVSSEEQGTWHPEDGYTWVDRSVPGDFRVVDNGLVDEVIRAASVVVRLNEQKARLEELSGLNQYDRVESALKILATDWVISMPLARSSAQREILIEQAKGELKGLMKQALQASVNQMSGDIKKLTPFWWDPSAAHKRELIARWDREVLELKGRAEHEIDDTSILREVRSGSDRSVLQYQSGQALRQLLEINTKRSWAK